MDLVLQIDCAGTPQEWLRPEDAASIICAGDMLWQYGPTLTTLHGGWNRDGVQSTLDIPAVIGTRGQSSINLAAMVPSLTNPKLFARDLHLCAYCTAVFQPRFLTRDHVQATSRGGKDVWTNVVTACKGCNGRKAARSPEEAGMKLAYVPYAPNWFEDFLLRQSGRVILADQMQFLVDRLPAHSRLRPNA